MSAPPRPSLPADATWSESDQEWMLAAVDEQGRKHGPVRYWRPDGVLVNECSYEHGAPVGAFKRFHDNGEVSREGQFVDGKVHGIDLAYRSTEPTRENWVPAGILSGMLSKGGSTARPEDVWKVESEYARGRIVRMKLYDRSGTALTT